MAILGTYGGPTGIPISKCPPKLVRNLILLKQQRPAHS